MSFFIIKCILRLVDFFKIYDNMVNIGGLIMSDLSKTIFYCSEIVNRFHENNLTSEICGLDGDTYLKLLEILNSVREESPTLSFGELKTKQTLATQEFLDKHNIS